MRTVGLFVVMGSLLAAQVPQTPNPTQQSSPVQSGASMPVYRVTVVARTTKAINYHHRSGATKIDFRGTALMPEARGEAKVESKQGVIKIDANMEKLQPASRFGPEYLTYVMWAITPEGRATNIGEVLLGGDKSKLNATTELQSFGLIVTAEPYFAVTQPSDVVVMENFVRHDTTGTIEEVDAKYELLQRGQYTLNVNPSELKPMQLDTRVPLELYEARNAVQIARWAGADKYAAETFEKALQGLQNAEGYLRGKQGKKPIGTVAREAAQMAEDARIITVKKIEEERLANERAAAAEREARAKAETEAETRRRAKAEADQKAKPNAGPAPRPNEPPRSLRQSVSNEKLRQRGQPHRLKPNVSNERPTRSAPPHRPKSSVLAGRKQKRKQHVPPQWHSRRRPRPKLTKRALPLRMLTDCVRKPRQRKPSCAHSCCDSSTQFLKHETPPGA